MSLYLMSASEKNVQCLIFVEALVVSVIEGTKPYSKVGEIRHIATFAHYQAEVVAAERLKVLETVEPFFRDQLKEVSW